MKRRTKYFMMKQFPFLRCAEAVLPIALRPLRWAVCDLRARERRCGVPHRAQGWRAGDLCGGDRLRAGGVWLCCGPRRGATCAWVRSTKLLLRACRPALCADRRHAADRPRRSGCLRQRAIRCLWSNRGVRPYQNCSASLRQKYGKLFDCPPLVVRNSPQRKG